MLAVQLLERPGISHLASRGKLEVGGSHALWTIRRAQPPLRLSPAPEKNSRRGTVLEESDDGGRRS
jgi:hypothetical protein